MKRTLLSIFAATVFLSSTAQSSPLSGLRSALNSDVTNGNVETVTYRSSRHCYWRDGERRCYNSYRRYDNERYYGYNEYYGRGPGIYLNFGGRRNYHRNWYRHDHVDNNLNFGLGRRHYK